MGEEWELIYEEEIYLPSPQDVGHIFKIECFVCTSPSQQYEKEELIVGPVFVYTEPVLNYPSAYLSRTRINSSGENIEPSKSSPDVLRVVSYNILAEIYATKMVYIIY
jgi:hypothetical protein